MRLHGRAWAPAALALLASACGSPSLGSGASSAGDLRVRRGDLQETVLLTGEIDAAHSEALVTPTTPRWSLSIQWMAEDGVPVKAGETVLEFDASSLATQIEQLELQEEQAEGALEKQEAEDAVAAASKEFEVVRQRLLLEKAELRAGVPEDALARRDWQERQLELARVGSALASAEESLATQRTAARLAREVQEITLDKIRREVEHARASLESLTLRAPRDGLMLIGEHPWMGRKFDVGDESWPGMTVVRLPDLSGMRVQATLSDVDDGRVAEGQSVRCVLDAWPERSYPGRVVSVSAIASPADRGSLRRQFLVGIELDASDPERMVPGMSVRVEVAGREAKDALLVPRSSLSFAPDRARRRDGTWAEVELGLCDAAACELRSGLEEGALLREARGS